jgi:hypothetical protein
LRNTPLFTAEYLADREYNRTGTAPTKLLKSASAAKLSDASNKSSSKHAKKSSSRAGLAKPLAGAPASAASSANSLQDVELAYGSNVSANPAVDGSDDNSSGSNSRDLHVLVAPVTPVGGSGANAGAGGGRGLALPFTPMSVAFKDICYYVDLPGVSSYSWSSGGLYCIRMLMLCCVAAEQLLAPSLRLALCSLASGTAAAGWRSLC